LIRKASIKDIKELVEIEKEIFDDNNFPLSRSCFYYHIKRSILLVYEEEGKIIGYILWLKRENYYRLYSIGVRKEYQGKSIAQKLLDYSFSILNDKKKYTLEVRSDNFRAINFYKRNGFKVVKILKSYYLDGVDGYKMEKSLFKN
jgi:ribosomal-protein-alanine N-acetyltransferase